MIYGLEKYTVISLSREALEQIICSFILSHLRKALCWDILSPLIHNSPEFQSSGTNENIAWPFSQCLLIEKDDYDEETVNYSTTPQNGRWRWTALPQTLPVWDIGLQRPLPLRSFLWLPARCQLWQKNKNVSKTSSNFLSCPVIITYTTS